MALLHIPLAALRKSVPWSISVPAWHERLGDVVLICGILTAGSVEISVNLAWWQSLIACGICILPAPGPRQDGMAHDLHGLQHDAGPVVLDRLTRRGS